MGVTRQDSRSIQSEFNPQPEASLVSQGPSGTYGVGRMHRRGRVPDGLPHRSPDAARNATGTGDLTWRDLRRPLKSPNPIVSLTRLSHVLEG